MLGLLIHRYRKVQGINQTEFVKRLAGYGWQCGLPNLGKIETAAHKGEMRRFTSEQVLAVSQTTGYSKFVCFLWAGMLPFEPTDLDDQLHDAKIEVAWAMFCAAIGRTDLGPPITADLTKILRLDEPASPQEEFKQAREQIVNAQVSEEHLDAAREMGATIRSSGDSETRPGTLHDPLDEMFD